MKFAVMWVPAILVAAAMLVTPTALDAQETSVDDAAPPSARYAKKVEVLGIYVYATNTVNDDKLLHAAGVLAQYLDNDEDGEADNPKIMKALVEARGAIIMRKTEQEQITGPSPTGRELYDDETRPNALAEGTFDNSWEEILHMITDRGWSNAYPDIFGRVLGSDQGNAMDLARGGQFMGVPEEYPDGAWFTCSHAPCAYDCHNTEYIYYAITTFMGIQDIPGRAEQIAHEWRLTTKAQLKERDPAIYAILSRPEYNVPAVIPDGSYDGRPLKIEPYEPE